MLEMVWNGWRYLKAQMRRSQPGATLSEYIMLIGFIAVMLIAIVIGFRTIMGQAITNAGNQLSTFH